MNILHSPWPYSDHDPEPRVSLWEIIGLGIVFAAIVVVTFVGVEVLGVL